MPFMRGLRITGGNRLSGTIVAHGAKNAVLPILAATVLCSRSEIKNCPNLSDVAVSCHILRHLGFAVERAKDTLIITREDTGCRDVPSEWMRAMRSSILFLGGMLARCGSVTLCPPGGCALGGRPIDLHLSALRQMGAVISEEGDTLRCAAPGGLHGAAVQLPYPSVGATENLLIAAAGTPAETKITGAAAEPEISDLLAYLRGCGALIESQPDGAILVQGREALTGCCCHAILPDRIEAATYLAAAAITGGEITVYARPEHLAAPLAALRRMGCRITTGEQSITLTAPEHLQGAGSIVTLPYPGFPTDLQAIFMALAAAAEGYTAFTETVFPRRWAHVEELRRLGADITVVGSHAVIRGASLIGSALTCTDLRAGAAVVLAALAAKGESSVTAISHIERGYADFVPTLRHLGADICLTEV